MLTMPCNDACQTANYWVNGGLKNLDCNILVGRTKTDNLNPLNILLNADLDCESSYTTWVGQSNLESFPADLKLHYMRKCYDCELL